MGTIAEKLNYLNTTKVNIKNAIVAKGVSVSDSDTFRSYASKIADIEPTLGTKTITANGTYTASDDSLQGYSEVTVDIDDTDLYRDTTDSTYESVKTLSNCGAFPMLSLTAEINAVQDLHGYEKPWAGGAGKNKLEFSLADCKSMTQNSGATWSENVLSHAGVNFSVEEDGIVKTNGTASSNAILRYAYITPSVSGDYIINGLPQDGGDDTFEIMLVDGTFTTLIEPNSVASGTTVTLTAGKRYGIQIIFRNGYNSNGLTFKPMIRLSTETDATFEPYSNICPISGWDEVNVNVVGKNLIPKDMNANNGFKSQYALLPDGTGNVDLGLDVSEFFKVPSSGKITLSGLTGHGRSYCFYDKDKNYISGDNYQNRTTITVTVPANAVFIRLTLVHRDSATQNTDEMVEIGSTATIYEPYNGSTITIQLGDTYYGCKLDVVSGVLSAVPYYASYNGETLVGEWISDRDKYEVGTTPTIGAQVVNIGATPTTIQLSPTQVNSLMGVNNIWANSGDVGDARYFKKVEL